MAHRLVSLAATTSLVLAGGHALATPSFTPLGDLPGGGFDSRANAVSADGSVVVGMSESGAVAPAQEAMRWTRSGGMVPLGGLPGGLPNSGALGVSGDGEVVAGLANVGVPNIWDAFRWTPSNGMEGLGAAGDITFAAAVSADGNAIVGQFGGANQEAFMWTESGGRSLLGDLDGGAFSSEATGVSADGSVVVGHASSANGPEAFRWTATGGMVGLGDLPGGIFYSQAEAVTPDGSVVVGASISAGNGPTDAFRWSAETGMVGLGTLAGGSTRAFAVSADGATIVGWSDNVAFIWDADGGMRDFKELLESEWGLDLTGWQLTHALGISDDGMTIVGYGTNPAGQTEGWVATVPEPSTGLLLGFGLAAALAVARRARTSARSSPCL